MIFENDYKVEIESTGKNYDATNKAILGYLEDIASRHSDLVGYGPNDLQKTKRTWLLADWELQIKKRPHYKDELLIKTWARNSEMCTSYRDFEVFNCNNDLIAKATSKWIFFNYETRKIQKLIPEIIRLYNPEIERRVFDNEKISKLKIPDKYSNSVECTIRRTDIDINGHMHNLNYLDLAYEALPQEVYEKEEFNNIRISYKKEIKLGDKVNCLYSSENGNNVVVIKDKDEEITHAIIEIR